MFSFRACIKEVLLLKHAALHENITQSAWQFLVSLAQGEVTGTWGLWQMSNPDGFPLVASMPEGCHFLWW